jgi:hypothetical protein
MSTNPYDSPLAPPRKAWSGATKLVVGLGAGCATLVIVCCGGFATVAYLTGNWTSNSTISFASTVRSRTAEIAEITIPAALAPLTSYQASRAGKKVLTVVVYTDASGSSLAMAQRDPSTDENLRAQMDDLLRGAGFRREELLGEEIEKFEAQIHEQPARFSIIKGKGQDSGQTYWRASGEFQGKGGAAMLVLQLRTAEYTMEQMMDVLKSIH